MCRDPKNQIKVVLIHKIDRLARNVADHAMIRVVLRKVGARVASVVENLDDSTSGQLVEHMMAAVAEFHSSNLSEETKKGMRQKVLQGGWPHLPPRGYTVERVGLQSRVIVDPVEGPLMAEAFGLYASGWYSVKRVTQHLAAKGLRARNLAPLSHSHMHRLLGNPFYAGTIEWKDLRVQGQHQALVSREIFDRVQQIRRGRRTTPSFREGLASFPIRLIGRCASCGGRVTVDRRPRWQYYRCSRQAYRRELCASRFCRVEKAHASLNRILRALRIDESRSLIDVLTALRDVDRVYFLSEVFEKVSLSGDGVLGFDLNPFWMNSVVRVSPLLNAA